jgi:hypothetical protein
MRSSITTAIVAGSLLLTVNAAMAVSPANPIAQHARAARAPETQYVAARPAPARNQLNADVAQFIQGMLGGGPIPYANLVRDVQSMRGTGAYTGSDSSALTYDTPVDTSMPDSGAAAAQAASDEENQTIQELNDENALTASMAAAEEENDEANAAALQTEINAGM